MSHPFDPGPVHEPFASLARDYPGTETYPPGDFRVEWGPIFHRGRLDGTARVLVLGQDPGQHESIARRILVGEAGQRVQGFLAKLGIMRSYVMINAFLYSVYGQHGGSAHRDDPAIAAYRHRWLDALLVDSGVQAVVAFGALANAAYEQWRVTPAGAASDVTYEPLGHPTYPEASSKGDPDKRAEANRQMLGRWNDALERLWPAVSDPDVVPEREPYDVEDSPTVAPIPQCDLPAGSPPWMRSLRTWAQRKGDDAEEKRATVVVRVPPGERPWTTG